MKNILIIGAGRSSISLIQYLLDHAVEEKWFITVADADLNLATQKVNGHQMGRGIWLDVQKPNDRKEIIARADIIVSLLPAHLHLKVATDCIKLKKHLITASYVSREMYRLGDEAREASLVFVGKMGLDPGVDHMAAMQKLDKIRAKGGEITSFVSAAGGLADKKSLKNNPWKYKFTWNPRNSILAGQGTAQYFEGGKKRFEHYSRVFVNPKTTNIPNFGEMEMYPNRDSLLYREAYGLENTPNIKRYTLRYPGFCEAWNALIQLGLTDGNYPIHGCETMTWHELMDAIAPKASASVKERIAHMLGITTEDPIFKKLDWLGLFRKTKIGIADATPALILEHLLLNKFKKSPKDKDLILMQHEIEYRLNKKDYRLVSTMILKGEDDNTTAMSTLVGLPMAIFTKLVLQGKIKSTGVNIPLVKEVYEPVLEELKNYGIEFIETETEITK